MVGSSDLFAAVRAFAVLVERLTAVTAFAVGKDVHATNATPQVGSSAAPAGDVASVVVTGAGSGGRGHGRLLGIVVY
jgi:hypothetical protein